MYGATISYCLNIYSLSVLKKERNNMKVEIGSWSQETKSSTQLLWTNISVLIVGFSGHDLTNVQFEMTFKYAAHKEMVSFGILHNWGTLKVGVYYIINLAVFYFLFLNKLYIYYFLIFIRYLWTFSLLSFSYFFYSLFMNIFCSPLNYSFDINKKKTQILFGIIFPLKLKRFKFYLAVILN